MYSPGIEPAQDTSESLRRAALLSRWSRPITAVAGTRDSLMREIAELTSFGEANQQRRDEEDVYDDGTNAVEALRSASEGWLVDDGSANEERVSRSQLRVAAGMDFDDDVRYKGKRMSRASIPGLMDDNSDEEDSDEMEDDEDEDDDDGDGDGMGADGGDDDGDADEESEDGSGGGGGDVEYGDGLRRRASVEGDSEEATSSEGEGSDDDGETDEDDARLDGENLEEEMRRLRAEDGGMAVLLKRSRAEQRERAEAAKGYREMWNRLLEVRILLQRLLGLANRLPRPPEAHSAFRSVDAQAATGLDDAAGELKKALGGLLTLRAAQEGQTAQADSEEMPSVGRKRKRVSLEGRSDGEVWQIITENHEGRREKWREVLDRAHQRATLSSSVAASRKFRVVNQGLWRQVEASLADRGRALKKSCMPRTQAQWIGRMSVAAPEDEPASSALVSDGDEEPDAEAFEDAELYQLLLRDFIESVGPAGLGADLGEARLVPRVKRTKKKVDTKASKGRKIRYVLHPKLEHFMFPVPLPPTPMDFEKLFKSLPGRTNVRPRDAAGQ